MVPHGPPQFPIHSQPRSWLLTAGASPIGIALARAVLDHGDFVALGVLPSDIATDYGWGTADERAEQFGRFLKEEVGTQPAWKARCKLVHLDTRCEALVRELDRLGAAS